MAKERVKDPNDYVSEGDIIKVKVVDIDRFGKIKLSAKAIEPLVNKNPKANNSKKEEAKQDNA
jgi:polyribonucleotide nucleotidyltransferase